MATESRKRVVLESATLDFASIAADGIGELTIDLADAAIGDVVVLGTPVLDAGLMATAYVSVAGTVTIRLHNTTIGAIDPASATWTVGLIL